MDSFEIFVVIFLAVCTLFIIRSSTSRKGKGGRRPPGPTPLPLFGNMFQLGTHPHRSLTKLSKKHGPLMSLQLGKLYTIIVTSPELAREVLQKQDHVFSNRIIPSAAHAHDHHKNSMAFLPIGDAWRKIRQLCKKQIFSHFRLEASQPLCEARLNKLREYLQSSCDAGRTVNLGNAVFLTTANLMSTTFFSLEFAEFDSAVTGEFRETIEGVARILGVPNFADYFPILQPFDLQGIRKRADIGFGKVLDLIGNLLNDRKRERTRSPPPPKKSDLLEALIDLSEGSAEGEYRMNDNDIKHLLLDLFVAATDTTASTTEWAMTELLRNPDKLAKAQAELRTVIGLENQVKESDMSKLPYLHCVIKEVFRYHPPSPLLIPHKAELDVELNGYMIPEGTQTLINVWAMGRDDNVWPNPESFVPERFQGKKTDFKGQDFELIPFGSGRRICPGMPLVTRVLPLTVATLIHSFNWKLEPGIKPEMIDTTENFGMTIRKAIPLQAIPSRALGGNGEMI